MSAVDDQVDARITVKLMRSVLPRPTLELVVGVGMGYSLKALADAHGAKLETTKTRLSVARLRVGEMLDDVTVGCVVAAA
jgi:hypothetical protein